jgi:DNA invertase Pin-like site-specific DNA recombinase
MSAVGYVRVSTEDQAKEGVSLDNQKSKIKAYCQLKDLELRELIEDAGISAKNLRRPGVQKVLRLARRREIDAVVVYKLDRIFRSTVDALETTKAFDKWGSYCIPLMKPWIQEVPWGGSFSPSPPHWLKWKGD